MKKVHPIFLLIMLCSFITYGQDYHKLLNESTYWDVTGAEMGYICSGFSSTAPRRYSFSGDTLINGQIYAKAYYYIMSPIYHTPPPNCPPFHADTNSSNVNWYFLREDTIEQKVWRYDKYNDEVILLYDFSLEKGDTLYHDFLFPTTIDTVYEITTNDGKTRKKFEVDGGFYGGYYIEGIGGYAGIFSGPFYYFESGSWLMCVKDFDNNVILDINGNCFDFITGNSEAKQVTATKIYPNPFRAQINVESGHNITHIIVYNNLGQVVSKKKDISGNIFDLSKLESGMYLIKVMSGNTEIHSEMMKKNSVQ